MKSNRDKNARIRDLSNNKPNRKLGEVDDGKKKMVKEDNSKLSTSRSSINLIKARQRNNSHCFGKVSPDISKRASANIKVVSRFRPLNDRETEITKETSVEFLGDDLLEIKSQAEKNSYKFTFDKVFPPDTTQQEIYEYSAKPIIDSVLEGFNGTIFAYGQTASGKTYTMEGVLDNPEKEGIIPRMIRHVFHQISCSNSDIEFTVKVSMLEIYMEKIRDLIDLSKTNLNVRYDKAKGIYIENLSEHYVANEEDMMGYVRCGSANRTVASTNCNDFSSRSHSIFIITIHQNNIKELGAKNGKLFLVDLAGSEKISKTGAIGLILDEAKMINKSLTCLGIVINALTDGKSKYVPYRESKLTRVLQESLGGNAKTCLIITCSASSYNECESLSTLRFGMRAKKIKNKPKINKEATVAELKMEIEKLELLLVICNNRIKQLEKFIVMNNLLVPEEGDMTFMKDSSKLETEKSKKTPDTLESDVNLMRDLKEDLITDISGNEGRDLSELISDNHSVKSENDIDANDAKIDSFTGNEIREIADKYSGVIEKMTSLDEEKKDLNDKLEDALTRIADLQASLDQKEKIEEELESIKTMYHTTVAELNEKNIRLNEKREIERNKIIIPHGEENITRDQDNSQTKIEMEGAFNKMKDFFTDSQNASLSYQELRQGFMNLCGSIINLRGRDCSNNSLPFHNPLKKSNTINTDRESSEFDNECPIAFTMDETIKKERKKHENEKKLLFKNLQEKNEQISSYEAEQQELKDKIKLLEDQMTPDDKDYVKKIMTLEKNLEQVNMMYHQVVTQKSVLKIDNQVMEKKIKKRNEKIMTLDKEIFDLKEQLKMRDEKLAAYQKSHTKNVGGPQVVKVLRGGSSMINWENQTQTVNALPTSSNSVNASKGNTPQN